MPHAPALWCLLAAVLFGAATPASKALLGTLSPITLAGLLYLGAAAAVLPFSFHGGSPALRREGRNVLRLCGAVACGGVVGPVLFLLGLARAPAATVALWLNLEVVATAALASAFFREHLGPRDWAAAAAVLVAGMLLAAAPVAGSPRAAVLVGAASVCWALDNNLTSLIDGFTPAQYTLVKGLVAGSMNVALGRAFESGATAGPMVLPALGIGALGYGASLVLYVAGAQHVGAARSQMLFAAAPFVGAVLSWTALGEPLEPRQLLAAAVMIAGVAALLSSRHAHRHTHQPTTHTHSHRHDDRHHEHVHPGLPADTRHTHPHDHGPLTHAHPHAPDLHHRHGH